MRKLESLAIMLVALLSLVIVFFIVQYSMIEEKSTTDNLVQEISAENEKAKKVQVEKTEVEVKVENPTEESVEEIDSDIDSESDDDL